MSKFNWLKCDPVKLGSDPNHSLEVEGGVTDGGSVIVGVGARINSDNDFTTLALWVAPIENDGTIGKAKEMRFGSDPDHDLEAAGQVGSQEVLTGIGMRESGGNLTTLVLYGRRLDANTGRLSTAVSTYKFGKDPNHELEVDWDSCDGAQTIVTSVGLRASGGNVTTMVLGTGNLV